MANYSLALPTFLAQSTTHGMSNKPSYQKIRAGIWNFTKIANHVYFQKTFVYQNMINVL